MFAADEEVVDPCVRGGRPACDASALCVRSAGDEAFACLCPDGLVPDDDSEVRERRKCVISRSEVSGGGGGNESGGAAACALACGAGACEAAAGGARCRCPPLFAGARCQHYRCAQHCQRRGRCHLDPDRPHDDPPPLKCTCNPGYWGARCEHAAAPEGAGGAGDICQLVCLNQGTCSVSAMGAVSCACPPAWSGERCQRPACVDAACAAHADGSGAPAAPTAQPTPQPTTHPTAQPTAQPTAAGDHTPAEPAIESCSRGECLNGGRCVQSAAGGVCACAGAWGGARCRIYLGYDHACAARACPPPAICAWGPDPSPQQPGLVFCACLEGASCTPPERGAGAGAAPAERAALL